MRAAIVLMAAAGLALSACAGEPAAKQDGAGEDAAYAVQVVDLSVDELAALRETQDIRLIDVRTDEEVAEGVIPGAEQIVLDEFDPALLDLSDGREVVLYCRSGRRSAIAAERLAEHTGRPASHLAGGINAWREAGGDIVQITTEATP